MLRGHVSASLTNVTTFCVNQGAVTSHPGQYEDEATSPGMGKLQPKQRSAANGLDSTSMADLPGLATYKKRFEPRV